jgi:hypothetical protein
MCTYIPDQWLRHWFLGGPAEVLYRFAGQMRHTSPPDFVADLATVWKNAANVCVDQAKLVVRFGGINDRKQEPLALLRTSLLKAGWRIQTVRHAGNATRGKRQAEHFARVPKKPLDEYDVHAIWEP